MQNDVNVHRHERRHALPQIQVREPFLRYSIAFFVPAFGILGVVTILGREVVKESPTRAGIIIALALSTIPMGALISRMNLANIWWSKRAPIRGANVLFVAYADAGVATVLFVIDEPDGALHGTALFAVIGCYAAFFVKPRVLVAHMLFTSIVVVVFGISMWTGGYPLASAVSRIVTSLISINGTVALLSMSSIGLKRSVRTQFRLANTDPLTGLLNRRGFIQWSADMVMETTGSFSVMLIDVDHYKSINDEFGHSVGDTLLADIAANLKQAVGRDVVVARIGGDEFAVATTVDRPALDALGARMLARGRTTLGTRQVTLSIGAGLCQIDKSQNSNFDIGRRIVSETLTAADSALYRAKVGGRDRVHCEEFVLPEIG